MENQKGRNHTGKECAILPVNPSSPPMLEETARPAHLAEYQPNVLESEGHTNDTYITYTKMLESHSSLKY